MQLEKRVEPSRNPDKIPTEGEKEIRRAALREKKAKIRGLPHDSGEGGKNRGEETRKKKGPHLKKKRRKKEECSRPRRRETGVFVY